MASRLDDEQDGSPGSDIDLRHYLAILRKRWWVILCVTIAVTALSFVLTNRKPRIYQASATVIVDLQAPNVLGVQGAEVVQLGGGAWYNIDYYNTQYRILTSRSLAEQTVLRYGLQSDERLVGKVAQMPEEARVELATNRLRSMVRVSLIKDSRVFVISVRDTNPALARDLANDLAAVYTDQNVRVKRDLTRSAGSWVNKLLDDSSRELDRTERALYDYKRNNNMLSVSLEDRQNIISKKLSMFSDAMTDTQKKRIELQTRRRAVAALVEEDAVLSHTSSLADAPSLDVLREAYSQERRALLALEERYEEKHPAVVAQRAKVEAALHDVRQEATSMVKAMDAEIKALQQAEAQYKAEVESLTAEAFEINKRELEYKKLSRDADNAAKIYAQLLERRDISDLQEQDYANNIRPLDQAITPTAPVEPNLRDSLLMGFVAGLMLALGSAFLIEYLDRSVKTQQDIEGGVGVHFLGMVPAIEESVTAKEGITPELFIARHPKSTVAECARVVRTNILFASPDRPLRSMLVTSANPVEGKTTSVVNLGIVMATSGHRTLVVDSDMRRPRLHKALKVSNDRGLSQLILGESDIESSVKSTEVPGLFFLPCGPIPPNPAELLQSERFKAVVAGLCEKFDRVIFDSPPILAVTDSAIIAQLVDATVIVARANRTPRETLVRAKRLLDNAKARIIGAILNDVNLRSPHYASYYNSYYYQYHQPAPSSAGGSDGDT